MELSIRERLVIQSLLPKEGNFITLKILRKLQEDLSFSEEELALYKIVPKDNMVSWDNTVQPQEKEIPIGQKAVDIIKESLVKLDEQKKLNQEHFDIYVKFMGDKD